MSLESKHLGSHLGSTYVTSSKLLNLVCLHLQNKDNYSTKCSFVFRIKAVSTCNGFGTEPCIWYTLNKWYLLWCYFILTYDNGIF